ncbi:MAG: UDP-2,3-diacylglucosamine diphosphatase [Bacteroidia bacterium]|nr:UDP-2,3-diacylglucosamine diphosphatase [Bacteroidia bacterium]
MSRRKVDIVVLSDIHLGTYGCHAEELVTYLKSIQPGMLILNGDIIDIWQFSKRFWPPSHMAVIKEFLRVASKGVPVYYLTGNHDELLRKFSDFSLGTFHLRDKLLLDLPEGKAWIFHGDIFDASMKHAKWLAKMGAVGYDFLIFLNGIINWSLARIGKGKMSFSKRVKNGVKSAIKYISDFEDIAADLAIDQHYEYVICGHIHQPQIRGIVKPNGKVTYLNSGDWIENLTALEYHEQKWSLFRYENMEPAEKLLSTIEDSISEEEEKQFRPEVLVIS